MRMGAARAIAGPVLIGVLDMGVRVLMLLWKDDRGATDWSLNP
jgi:hypothetical protein